MGEAGKQSKQGLESQLERAEELDALDAILPFNRREKLAELGV